MFTFSKNMKVLKFLPPVRSFSTNNQAINNNMHKPILYGDQASPPVRFVMMTAHLLDIELDFHQIDLFRGEQKSAFYKKVNPLQKVPAFAVNKNFIIRDSHAIAIYLCQQSNHQDLYPKDTVVKAKVDEMLFFNASVLFPTDSLVFSEYFAGVWPAQEKHILQWNSLLEYLENMLNQNIWLVNDKMRLCDICCAATISSMRLLLPSLERYVKLNQWMKKMESLPCFEINAKGLERLNFFLKNVNV